MRRPLLRAMQPDGEGPPPVLLIDEVDRADDEFEAFLLEVLSDYAVTVPELGTFTAVDPPVVVLTSNRTRDVHDALKRRCLYHWVEHPDFAREVADRHARGRRGSPPELARQVAAMTERFRDLGLYKPPGVAESIDWARGARHPRQRPPRPRARPGPRSARCSSTARTRSGCAEVGLPDLVEARTRAACRAPERRDRSGSAGRDRGRLRRRPALRGAGGAGLGRGGYVEALGVLGTARPDDVYWAGRATLVRRAEDIAPYDRCFARVFLGVGGDERPTPPAPVVTVAFDTGADDATGTDDTPPGEPDVAVRWSRVEVLRHRDLAACDPAELEELWAALRRLRLGGATRRSRRRAPVGAGAGSLDLRRTVRAALRHGGEPLVRHHVAPTTRLRRVVLLVDVSGSMEAYARALLRFAHAAVQSHAAGRGLHPRHPAHPPHPGVRHPRSRRGPAPRHGHRGRPARGHPPRRRPGGVQRPLGGAGRGPGRRRGDPERRLGPG